MTSHDPTNRRTAPRSLVVVATVGVMSIAAGCGVPTGADSYEEISERDIPQRITDTTSTSSSTTTTSTTIADDPAPTTTTMPVPPTVDVLIYFLSRTDLTAIEIPAPRSVDESALVNTLTSLLEEGPSSPLLDTLIEPGLINGVLAENGVLTIDLDGQLFGEISSLDEGEAIAQIVLTFLGNLAGVGQALFTIDGEPLRVRTGNSVLTDDPVSLDDYENMLVDLETPDPSNTTTTVPEADDEPGDAGQPDDSTSTTVA